MDSIKKMKVALEKLVTDTSEQLNMLIHKELPTTIVSI